MCPSRQGALIVHSSKERCSEAVAVALPPLPEQGIAARERSRGRESGTGQETDRGNLPVVGPEPQSASRLAMRLELLRNTLRPTPHVPLAMEGMNLFAKLEYVNPVGSIKDRAAYWILKRAAERGEICDETTVIESSSGNFATALAAFTRLVGLRFIPVIDPNISGTYESFLRRICPTVVKVEERDDTGGFLKTRLQMVKHLCATIPNAYWTAWCQAPGALCAGTLRGA
jgi:cysteine synthase A